MLRTPIQKIIFLFIIILPATFIGMGQNCNTWLSMTSQPSYADIGQINITGNKITVEATINRTNPYSGGLLYAGDVVSKHNTPADANYLLRPNSAEITTSNGYFRTPDICEIEINKTYHVAMVYDGSILKFYRNGFLMSQVAASGDLFQNTWQTRVGFYEPQAVNTNFIGLINEVRIWNVAKTQSELKTYMNSLLPNPTSQVGLIAYYTFNTLINKQGNSAFDGTLGGSASINQINNRCAMSADSCKLTVNVQGIGGIINTYSPVISLDICKNKIVVEDASTFFTGDTVLLIQMKGAAIDSSNTASFGKVTNYNGAGNYEFNYIKAVSGNVLEFRNDLTRTYEVPTGKVQLIRVPYFFKTQITSLLTCLPWDGSKGGVLVLNVRDTIDMLAPIDVSGKGFRGGNSPNTGATTLFCFNNEFTNSVGTLSAAAKGESIVSLGNDKAWGKGSAGSGGGGGLGHNSGGGGGANAAAGGLGGYQLLTCGNAPFDNRGIGGSSLIYNNNQNKIFLGGGGGAGHVDNAGGSNMEGGNGGGIAIIIAPVLKSNDHPLMASGGNATQCDFINFSDCHDGSGGGGGGGVILLSNNIFISPTEININGGKGADLVIYNPGAGADKIGTGGGGGAGTAWFNSAGMPGNVTVEKAGGRNGVIIQNNNDAWGAGPGLDGSILFNLKIPVDTVLFKNNIDSVTIKDSATSCISFDLKGRAFTNHSLISQWQWNFGDGTKANTQNALHTYPVAGNYGIKLTVIDTNGCTDSTAIQVSTNADIPDAGTDTSICSNDFVIINLKGAGGNSYKWSPASFLDSDTLQDPVAIINTSTKFYLKVTNTLGCSNFDSVSIDVKNTPVLNGMKDTSVCGLASLQLNSSGAEFYKWAPSLGLSNATIGNPIANLSATTQYIVTGTNLNGCSATDTVNIIIKPQPIVLKLADTSVCRSLPVQLFASGGASYSWFPAATLNSAVIANPIASPTNSITYMVTVTGTNSCYKTDSIKITLKPLPVFMVSPDKKTCTSNSVVLSADGGTSYLWSPAALVDDPTSNTPVSHPVATTIFTVKIKDKTCDDSTTLSTTVAVLPPPSVNAFKSNDIDCVVSTAQLKASGADKYAWSPTSGLNDSNIFNPLTSTNVAQQYLVTGTDTSTNCTGTATISVFIKPPVDPDFFVPNAFSPNGDGRNDCFRIKHFGAVKSVDFAIYNRMGNLVFHTLNVNDCWDGTYKGGPADVGNYVYYIKTYNDCGENTRKGNLVLLR